MREIDVVSCDEVPATPTLLLTIALRPCLHPGSDQLLRGAPPRHHPLCRRARRLRGHALLRLLQPRSLHGRRAAGAAHPWQLAPGLPPPRQQLPSLRGCNPAPHASGWSFPRPSCLRLGQELFQSIPSTVPDRPSIILAVVVPLPVLRLLRLCLISPTSFPLFIF